MIKNYMEVLVENLLKDLQTDPRRKGEIKCTCESCMDSIRAMALNNMKPFYVTCKSGEVFGTYSNLVVQNQVDVLSEVMKAIDVVGKTPKH